MDTQELRRAWIEVNLDAMRRNADRLIRWAGVPIIAMLKADAYGMGAIAAGRALQHAPGVWALGVATVAEGKVLRDAGVSARLFCCTPVLVDELPAMHALGITPSLFRERDIRAWSALGNAHDRTAWHLLIDTGLNRAGVQWYETATLRDSIAEFPPEGAFTHFYASELHESSRSEQEERFGQGIKACALTTANPRVLVHADNSLAIEARPPATSERSPYGLARPGIALHGWPSVGELGLEAVATLRARVVDVRTVPAGEGVSYGATWIANSDARVATISIGYADGYRRALSNAATVVINGTASPLVGMVTMDMIMVNVTGVACTVGDVATLLGGAVGTGTALGEIAAAGGLSPYELLVGLKLRLDRVYVSNNHGPSFSGTPEQADQNFAAPSGHDFANGPQQ